MPERLDWVRRLQAIAQNGLQYTDSPFERERFEEVRAIAAELAAADESPLEQLLATFAAEEGHACPKIDVRADADKNLFGAQLFLDDLALKREVMQLGALRSFAASADDPAGELAAARQVLCKHNLELDFSAVRRRWASSRRSTTRRGTRPCSRT